MDSKEIFEYITKLERDLEILLRAMNEIVEGKGRPDIDSGDMRKGLFCGVEDRDITDSYQAAEHGFEKASEKTFEWAADIAGAAIDKTK